MFRSFGVKGEREGSGSCLGLELRLWEFIMEVPVLEPEMRGVPAILGVSHKGGTEDRLRETLMGCVRLGNTAL